MAFAEPLQVALQVAAALERCGVRYLVGGSVASSVTGEPRSTMDVDLVVALTQEDVEPFLGSLGNGFYADAETLRSAIRARARVNLIHRETSTKVDLFILGGTPLDDEQMERRVRLQVASGPDRCLYVYAAEDILLQKLRWYRLENEASDRHWRDILGIIGVQGPRLDRSYLRRGALTLGVTDLLDRALDQDSSGSGQLRCGIASVSSICHGCAPDRPTTAPSQVRSSDAR